MGEVYGRWNGVRDGRIEEIIALERYVTPHVRSNPLALRLR